MVGDGNEHHKYGLKKPNKIKKAFHIWRLGRLGLPIFFSNPFFRFAFVFWYTRPPSTNHFNPTLLTGNMTWGRPPEKGTGPEGREPLDDEEQWSDGAMMGWWDDEGGWHDATLKFIGEIFCLLQREVRMGFWWIFYPPFYWQKGGEASKMGCGTSKMVSSLLFGETFWRQSQCFFFGGGRCSKLCGAKEQPPMAFVYRN